MNKSVNYFVLLYLIFFSQITMASGSVHNLPQIQVPNGSKSMTLVSQQDCPHVFDNEPQDNENNRRLHWGNILYIRIDSDQKLLISSCAQPQDVNARTPCQTIILNEPASQLCKSENNSVRVRNYVVSTAFEVALTSLGLPPLLVRVAQGSWAFVNSARDSYNRVTTGKTNDEHPCPVVLSLLTSLSESPVDHKTQTDRSNSCSFRSITNAIINMTNPQKIQEIGRLPRVTITKGADQERRPYIIAEP
jgi:hypothetical protein